MTLRRAPKSQLTAQLRTLGVEAGDTLMVHASLRAVGPTEGRADGLLDAILAAVGPAGTLVMALDADADEPFDALETEVDVEDMGWLAEVFRNRQGVRVSDHVCARFAAIGAQASVIDDPPLHDYFGVDSPLHRLVAAGLKVLRLGADIDTVTVTHLAEYLADVPSKRRVTRTLVRADIGAQEVRSLDDTHGIRDWTGPGGQDDYFAQILLDYLAADHAQTAPVGHCAAELLRAQHFVDFAVAWMEREFGSLVSKE